MSQEFFMKSKLLNLYLTLGIIGTVFTFIFTIMSIALPGVHASVLMIVIAILGLGSYGYFRKNWILQVSDGNLVYNPSFLAGKRYYFMNELESLSVDEKAVRFLYQGKKAKIPLYSFSDEHKVQISALFSAEAAAVRAVQ